MDTWHGQNEAKAGKSKLLMERGDLVPQIAVLKLQLTLASPGGQITAQIAGPTPRFSNIVDLGWGSKICISSKFQVVVWGPYFEKY